jgi:hypothetical protein
LNGDVERFIMMWPNIRSALRQKCRDIKRASNAANRAEPLANATRTPNESDVDLINSDSE